MTKHGEFESGLVPLTLRVPKDLWDEMDQLRKQQKIKSMNEFIRLCIRSFLFESTPKAEKDWEDLSAEMKRLEALLLLNSLHQQMLVAKGLQKILIELGSEASLQDLVTVDEQILSTLTNSKTNLAQFLAEQQQMDET